LEYAALNSAPRIGLVMAFHHVHALDNHFALRGLDFDDAALLALVLAGNNDHPVVLSHIDLNVHFTVPWSNNLRGEAHDLHKPPLAQLSGDRPEHTRAHGLVVGFYYDRRVLIETDIRPVFAS